MRIPHYLTRGSSGSYTFRLRVPCSLQALLGRRVIKHALRTSDTRRAGLDALDLASRYARLFMEVERAAMRRKLTADDVERSLAEHGVRRYEIDLHSGRLKVDGPEDHALAMDALSRLDSIGMLAPQRPQEPAPPPEAKVAEAISMGKARDAWLKSMEASTSKKTLSIKSAAIESLTSFIGESRQLHTVNRPDLARWYQLLRDQDIATPTLTNKQSYIGGKRGFFAWAMASGHYPAGDNPAQGHVSYTANEKRKRRKFGFKAFTQDQVQTLFHPATFTKLSFHARWAILLGLYTGARVSEIGQLRVLDIVELDGIPCLQLTEEGDNQSLKTDLSRRIVPLHPHLVELGFLKHVKTLVAANEWQLFPKGKATAINGRGNWITKAFGPYLQTMGSSWTPAKRGFHSLRKTVIQEMQGGGVASEMRAQIVGHELDDEHHAVYSRDFTPAEKLLGAGEGKFRSAGLGVLNYGLDLKALAEVLANPTRTRKERARPAGKVGF